MSHSIKLCALALLACALINMGLMRAHPAGSEPAPSEQNESQLAVDSADRIGLDYLVFQTFSLKVLSGVCDVERPEEHPLYFSVWANRQKICGSFVPVSEFQFPTDCGVHAFEKPVNLEFTLDEFNPQLGYQQLARVHTILSDIINRGPVDIPLYSPFDNSLVYKFLVSAESPETSL